MKLQRFDSVPVNPTYYTEEGYLIDHPIVTTCGIFEYLHEDGSIRRELRLPEEVFKAKSLATYKGKPIIITHDAGAINKDNVDDEQIGTILSEGYQDGENVRAEIIIHNTDAMKECKLRELSLGYNLRLEDKSGEWNGEHYDAIQRDIEINHLALVDEARAGEAARLNVDGKKSQGGKPMKRSRRDGDAFEEAIEAYKARKNESENESEPNEELPQQPVEEQDEDEEELNNVPADNNNVPFADNVSEEDEEDEPVDEVQMVKDRRERRDSEGDPRDVESAMGVIAQQDEDIDTLLKLIEALKAKNDYVDAEDEPAPVTVEEEEEEEEFDCANDKSGSLNMDSVDKYISQKLEICRMGDKLGVEGIEKLDVLNGKKAIIKAVKPTVRLDGKSKSYIDAMYDIAKDDIAKRKSTDRQRMSMFNSDSKGKNEPSGAAEARERMIKRQMNGGN